MPIQILSTELANQIAAGEVVERPASVVKELVENSLDAGASHIEIEVERGGHKRLCIKDNGKGVAKDELTLALSRHATSKIFNLDDLENIMSLGFRGEALASISSVSRLTLTSKPENQDKAWQASTEGRDMHVKVEPAAYPQGTSIEVVDLFFNTPARRKFLRAEKTEFQHIDETLKRIALSRFDVSFTLKHNGKLVRKYPKLQDSTNPLKRIELVCGKAFSDNSVYVNSDLGKMSLKGWLSIPTLGRAQNDVQYVYVNGRAMRDKLINHALRQAYEGLIEPNTYPAYVLFLEVDPKLVDVNVHPAKHEVRFHQARLVHDFIFRVSNEALSSALQSTERFDSEASETASVLEQHEPQHQYVTPLQHQEYPCNSQQISEHEEDKIDRTRNVSANLQSHGGRFQGNSKSRDDHRSFTNYQSLMRTIEEPSHPDTNISFFQTAQSKVLIRLDNTVYYGELANLNALRLQQEFELSAPVKQPLLMPVSLALKAFSISQDTLQAFAEQGLDLQVEGQKVLLKQVPSGTRALNWTQILAEIVEHMQSSDDLKTVVEQFFHALSTAQISQVINQQGNADFVLQWLMQQNDASDLVKKATQVVPLQQWLSQFDDE